MSVSENIKKLREIYRLSQKELGEIAGVSDKAVSTWETGQKEPRMGAIQKIADYFGILKSNLIEDGGLDNTFDIRYRALDAHGRKNVDLILNSEYERCKQAAAKKAAMEYTPETVAANKPDNEYKEEHAHDLAMVTKLAQRKKERESQRKGN